VRIRRTIATCLTALSLSLVASSTSLSAPARAATAYVDGISDQSLPAWDGGFYHGYFTGLFNDAWVNGPDSHITLARYVVQWNVLSGKYSRYLSEFEAWLSDVTTIDLQPEIALTSYDGVYPSSPSEYQIRLEQILARVSAMGHPVRYLEAWNEPNDQGEESAANAANFTNAASATCGAGYGCTVIAGDFEDSPNVAGYEDQYVKGLDPVPVDWGVHPYYSVEEESEAPFANVREHLPNGGVGERIWFTEIAARRCSDFGGNLMENGEVGQARRANWLVNTLIKNVRPEHVFYYEFLLRERRQPSCESEGSDGALYTPSSDPAEPDRPRLAASYIWGGGSAMGAYSDESSAAFMPNAAQATLTGGR
jgi:hypothetical protein